MTQTTTQTKALGATEALGTGEAAGAVGGLGLDLAQGDCLNHLRHLPDLPAGSIDLVITSPPYADSRQKE